MPDQQYPIIERIAIDLLEALNSIRVVNGFSCDVDAVRPNPALGDRKADGKCVLVQGSPAKDPEKESDFFHHYWVQPFAIVAHVRLSEVTTEAGVMSIDTKLNCLIADIQKVVLIDIYRGQLASDTSLGEPELIAIDDSLVANSAEAIVPVVVEYRVSRVDPYSTTYSAT